MNKKGIFLSFEGPEASGKSSQIKEISKYLKKKKISHVITREPGGTFVSEKIRNIILNNKYNISNIEEILLLMASRLNHVNKVIKPALKKGKLVISDRYCDSTFVYQGTKESIKLHKQLLNNFLPNKTFLFLLTTKQILKRLNLRKKLNKYDVKNKKFHNKIIRRYKKISKTNKRFIIINAEKSFNEIQIDLRKKINRLLNK